MEVDVKPYISGELTDWLQTVFPNQLPKDPISEAGIARAIGRQDVIRKLLAAKAEQERAEIH